MAKQKKVRTLKYKTMSRSENAPVSGVITQDKDTIIVHQVSDTEAKAYATDQNGKLLEITSSSQSNAEGSNAIDKGGFLEMAREMPYIIKSIVMSGGKDWYFPIRAVGVEPIFHHNGERITQFSHLNKVNFYPTNEGADEQGIEFKSEDYPYYVGVRSKGSVGLIFGKNLGDYNYYYSTEYGTPVDEIHLIKIETDKEIRERVITVEYPEGAEVAVKPDSEGLNNVKMGVYNGHESLVYVVDDAEMWIDFKGERRSSYTITEKKTGKLLLEVNTRYGGTFLSRITSTENEFIIQKKEAE